MTEAVAAGAPERPIVLVITDSLGFPRLNPEPLPYGQTYVGLLKDRFREVDFIHHGRGGASIEELYEHCAYYREALVPDLVIMQSGVVDCAPRALKRIEQMAVNRIGLLRRLAGPLVRRYATTLRRIRKIRYTTPERFGTMMDRFETAFPRVCWIGIPPAAPEWEQKVAGISASVEMFNAILSTRDCLATGHLGPDDIMSDLHHPNIEGHRKIFELLRPRIEALLAARAAGS